MVDWSSLPYDLVFMIANRIPAIEDFLAFSAVCHSWRSVYVNKSWSPSPHFPWLMLCENRADESNRAFFSFQKKRCHLLPLPQAQERRCWGSSCGWLVTIGLDLQIHLLNPVTQIRIALPPQSTFPHQPTFIAAENRGWYRAHFIHKAFVFKTPVNGKRDELAVMAIHGMMNDHLAVAKPGYDSWVTVETSPLFVYEDVTVFKDKIFAICGSGTLVLIEIDGANSPRAKQISPPPDGALPWQKLYLVESSGELLLVYRIIGRLDDFSLGTISFEVYKFDFKANKWVRKDELGDQALFVGDNNSVSIACSSANCCKPNSIYFADDTSERRPGCQVQGNSDVGVYNMSNRSIKSLEYGVDFNILQSGGNFILNYSVPVWVIPSLS
ncbi:hypothetical protein NMG60_11001222 [Bertholletia excelsa]